MSFALRGNNTLESFENYNGIEKRQRGIAAGGTDSLGGTGLLNFLPFLQERGEECERFASGVFRRLRQKAP